MVGNACLDGKRLVIVTGKGGVGKTTVSAALAVQLAQRGQRVLVAMCNAKERLSVMLGSELIAADVIEVGQTIVGATRNGGGVWAVNMDPERALEEYGMMALHSRTLYKLLFDNKYVRTFFRAVPGLHEWSMLGKAWWHTTEKRGDGTWRFDTVILDAPATGHGLDMLRVPKVISEVVPPGLLRRDADRALELLRDPKMSAVVLVTLPEEMPTTETIELAAALTGELRLPIGRVVVNSVLPPLFSKAERDVLENVASITPTTAGDAAIVAGRDRAIRERVQAESLGRLSKELPIKPSFLPLLFEDAATPKAIRELAKRI
jgi:anion-transporting  ArsA/GET3 family ATPase